MPVSVAAGTAFVDIIPRFKEFGRQLQEGARKSFANVGATGKTLTKTLTPVAAGVGAAFLTAFNQVDAATDAIRAGTGATGKQLDELVGITKKVGAQVTQPLSEVGSTLADLQTRTGLVGKPLEELTKKTLDLARVTGGDAVGSVGSLTRVFGDWGVATEDQAETLDKVFRASQATGATVDQLSRQVVQFGSPLRQLGFGLEDSLAMLGKFEKEGVNTELVLGSLRIALGKAAKAGETDLPGALRKGMKAIKEAETGGEGAAKAIELFGARAGPDMAAAIREGRFDLDALVDQVANGTETIDKAAEDTLDWSDRLKMLKNRVQGVIGPVGEFGFAAAGVVAGIGPMLQGLGKMGGVLPAVAGGVSKLGGALIGLATNPIVLIVAAIAGLVFLIVKNWDTIKRVTLAVWGAIKAFVVGVWNAIKGVALAVWNGIKGAITGVWNAIRRVATTVWGGIKTAILTPIRAVVGAIRSILGTIRGIWSRAWGGMKRTVAAVWDGIKNVVKGAINAIIGAVELGINAWLAPFRRLSTLPVIGAAIPDVPVITLPRLAEGGRAVRAGLAIVGEEGPELLHMARGAQVVPLSGAGETFNITINNPKAEPSSLSLPAARRRVQLLRGR